MLPKEYVGLVIADTRRALAWEAGLRQAGFEVLRVETSGADLEKGDWQVGVKREQAVGARAFVTDVQQGRAKLRHQPLLSRSGWLALWAIGILMAGGVVAWWLAAR